MNKYLLNTLIVDDNDLECSCKIGNISLYDLSLEHISFNNNDLLKYDLIIYQGEKGCKILKSRLTKTGKVG